MEIIIVIAMFGALLALGLFMSMDAYRGFSFRSEEDTVVSLLQKARSRAMNNMNQTPWGVCWRDDTGQPGSHYYRLVDWHRVQPALGHHHSDNDNRTAGQPQFDYLNKQ